MTAEIVIMNRSAVALAADSAVTLSENKIYNTANKLFMLSPNHLVGVMVYNQSDLLGMPWETLIHDFGRQIDKKTQYKKLEEYPLKFEEWLQANLHKYCTDSQERVSVNHIISSAFIPIGQKIFNEVAEYTFNNGKRIPEKKVLEVSEKIVDQEINRLQSRTEFYNENEKSIIKTGLDTKYLKSIENLISRFFAGIPFDTIYLDRLKEIVFLGLTRESNSYTGLVFVGYGSGDLLPSCLSFRYEEGICHLLKKRKNDDECMEISYDGAIAGIIPFAQTDVILNVIHGIDPNLNQLLNNEIENRVSKTKAAEIEKALYTKFITPHKDSIMKAVNSLPIGELATMAESLVELTSFLRKVSMDAQTVGGPVDVAVISRSEGFVWIKKKVYYRNDINLHIRYNQKTS